jgi:hypothetical protein
MFWVLASGIVWGASISCLSWLIYWAPILDENERPVASATKTFPSQWNVRMGFRAVDLTKPANSLAWRLSDGGRHRSFHLTR